jgi:spindle assembly abnormal protein 6
VYSIVETTQFKHLTHLSLQFFPGDDAAVKAYLAARLAQVNAEKRVLSAKLRVTTVDRDARARNEAQMQTELDTLQQQTDALLSQERLHYADELNTQVWHCHC